MSNTINVNYMTRAYNQYQAFLITLQENQWNLRLSKMVIG